MTSRCFMPCEKLSTSSFSHRAKLEQLEHLADAWPDRGVVESVQAAMKSQEFAGGELLVEKRAIGNESERSFRALGIDGQIVAVDDHPS